jgi:HD superfamily phosphodiesterase
VEIWSDEARATCPRCKQNVVREGFSSCLDWCAKGRECVGETIFNNYMEKRSVTIRQQLISELEAFAGRNTDRIDRSVAVLRVAEELLKKECGDWSVVVPSAILHTFAAATEERTAGAAEAARAKKILLKIGLRIDQIDEICTVLAGYRAADANSSKNLKIIHDAVALSMVPAYTFVTAEEKAAFNIDSLLTPAARDIAVALFAKSI